MNEQCAHLWKWEMTGYYDDTELICQKCGAKKDLDGIGDEIAIEVEHPDYYFDVGGNIIELSCGCRQDHLWIEDDMYEILRKGDGNTIYVRWVG